MWSDAIKFQKAYKDFLENEAGMNGWLWQVSAETQAYFQKFCWQVVKEMLDNKDVWESVELIAAKLLEVDEVRFTDLYNILRARHKPFTPKRGPCFLD